MRISDKSKLPPNKSLLMNISSYCCQSNSYGLFDYHSTSNSEVNINGYGSFHLIHDGNNIVPKRNLLIDDNQVMHIAQSKQKYYVSSTFVELNNEWVDQISSSKPFDQKFLNNIRNVDVNHNHQTPNRNANSSENLYKHQMWSVIRNTKPNNHGFRGKKLEVDDVLKVGRYILKVVKISSHHKNEPVIKTNSNLWRLSINEHKSNKVIGVADNCFESHSKQKIRKTKTQHWNFTNKTKLIKENDIICRICLSDICEEGDSFISPCGCSGTMKYIHSSCLKSWLNSNKDIVEDEYCTTTRWNIITCELCKQQFNNASYQENGLNLLEYDKPNNGEYAVLELLNTEIKYEEKVKVYLVFKFSGLSELSIGRSSNVNIKIKDSTISRIHAYLKFVDNEIYLLDAESRYGCLYLLKEPLTINSGCDKQFIQINCTYFEINCMQIKTTFINSAKCKKISRAVSSVLNCIMCSEEPDQIFKGCEFGDCPEEFPEEIHKLVYFRDTKLNLLLQESIIDDSHFMLGRNSLKSYSLNSPKNDSINEERSFKKDLKFDSLSQSEEINNMPIIQIGDVGEENKELSIISSESHSDNQQNILNIEHLHSKENNANVKSYIIHSECVHHTIEDWEEEVKSMPIIDSNLLLESFKIHKNTGCIDFATNAESPFIQKIYGSNKIKDSIINNNEEIICIQNN